MLLLSPLLPSFAVALGCDDGSTTPPRARSPLPILSGTKVQTSSSWPAQTLGRVSG